MVASFSRGLLQICLIGLIFSSCLVVASPTFFDRPKLKPPIIQESWCSAFLQRLFPWRKKRSLTPPEKIAALLNAGVPVSRDFARGEYPISEGNKNRVRATANSGSIARFTNPPKDSDDIYDLLFSIHYWWFPGNIWHELFVGNHESEGDQFGYLGSGGIAESARYLGLYGDRVGAIETSAPATAIEEGSWRSFLPEGSSQPEHLMARLRERVEQEETHENPNVVGDSPLRTDTDGLMPRLDSVFSGLSWPLSGESPASERGGDLGGGSPYPLLHSSPFSATSSRDGHDGGSFTPSDSGSSSSGSNGSDTTPTSSDY